MNLIQLVVAVLSFYPWSAGDKNQLATETGFVKVSTRDSRYLAFENDSVFIPIGPNICFPRSELSTQGIREYYESYFQKLSQNGGNYTRIWLSAPHFEVEPQTAGMYDSGLAERTDAVVALAEKYGIRIKFCLEHFRKLTNSPARFAGSVAFDRPPYASQVQTMESFFESGIGKNLYLKRAEYLANRYADNPVVMGWELWNEINAVPLKDPQLLLNWTQEILPKVKERFPRQLVMQSLGSMDNPSAIELYRKYMQLPTNQIAQVHRYLDEGAQLPICQAPMDELAADAVRTLRAISPDKPVILSEVGAVEPNHAGPSRLYAKDTAGILLHDLLFAPFFSGAAAPGQSWHWEFYIHKNNLWGHFGRFQQAIKGFDPVAQKAQAREIQRKNGLKIYALEGQNTSLYWIRDATSNWKTELVEGHLPKPVQAQRITLNSKKNNRITFYDPWKNTWSAAENLSGTQAEIPAFTRSLVVRVEHDN
ncbi:glycoside hydrolase 5 family protein [Arundinibacter roseus]|uniref:Uncharacterized protein n=1 Tax=Arundinibacter roseus TaxID=2070510 RepID=A0A4R4KKD9_9BACT|nr:cellulase family glycosylhydrolase [Arundinibacter roseus]TDB67406.1 hypothetical protein EZE20_05520 [Arundinibacter roseus]